MYFMDAVKGLEEGKVFKRENWRSMFEFPYLVKDEYGILKLFRFGTFKEYPVTDEDVLADDWVEAEKEMYTVSKMEEKDGLLYITVEEVNTIDWPRIWNVFEFKRNLPYVELVYADHFKETVAKLQASNLEPFDYNFRKCPICENEIKLNSINEGRCSNGCVSYDVDPQAEDVLVSLFDSDSEEDTYFINLYEQAMGKNDRDKLVDLKKFQEAVLYWRENERYKDRLRVMKPMK